MLKILKHIFLYIKKKFFNTDDKYILNLYQELLLDLSNKKIEEKIFRYLYEKEICPSECAERLNNFLHSDIEITRWSITNISLKIKKKLQELSVKKIIDYENLSKKFKNKNKEIFIFNTYPSFIAYGLNLAVIYDYFNIKCNIFFGTDEDEKKDMNVNYKKIFLKEIEFFKKNFKSINLININDLKSEKKLPKSIKEEIKLVSVIDTIIMKQAFLFKKNEKYKEMAKKIRDKSNLKYRYKKNLSTAKKLFDHINKDQHWIIHNSNCGEWGSIQKIVNFKKSSYCSFEYLDTLTEKREREFKIQLSKNSEVLECNVSSKINYYLNNNLNNNSYQEYGKNKFISLYKNNYSQNEIYDFYKKYPELENYEKNKVFLFLSNSLIDTRFYNSYAHSIYNNIDEFLIELAKFFETKDLKLILRYHPVDVEIGTTYYDDIKGIINKVGNFKNTYICDDKLISSYSLSAITNNIIIYASDIGAEMIRLKKNIITCAKAIYQDFNLTYFPNSKEDLLEKIIFLSNNNNFQITENDINKSYLYQHFYDYCLFEDFFMLIGNSSNQIITNFNDVTNELIKSEKEKSSVLLDFL